MKQTLLCGSLFDGEHDDLFSTVLLTITDGLIESISNTQPTERVNFLDLSQYTVLPGFIDCHDHVCLDPGDEIGQAQEPLAWLAIRGVARVRTIVEFGVKT